MAEDFEPERSKTWKWPKVHEFFPAGRARTAAREHDPFVGRKFF
jgi:hypothetical protein